MKFAGQHQFSSILEMNSKMLLLAISIASSLIIGCEKEAVVQNRQIEENLKPLPFTLETTGEKAPKITDFFNVSFSTKKESTTLKWKLVLEPKSNFTKILSEELVKINEAKSGQNGVSMIKGNSNAIFRISFKDKDGFLVHEAQAGRSYYSSVIDSVKGGTETGSPGEISSDQNKKEVVYLGEIESIDSKINVISIATIKCSLEADFSALLVEVLKEKASQN